MLLIGTALNLAVLRIQVKDLSKIKGYNWFGERHWLYSRISDPDIASFSGDPGVKTDSATNEKLSKR